MWKVAVASLLVATFGIVMPAGAHGTFAASASCTTAGLPAPVLRRVGGVPVWVRPLAVVGDSAIDDFGQSANGDSLVIFCVTRRRDAQLGHTAFCLTGETCPWGEARHAKPAPKPPANL